jgi:hypothetical protein
MLRIMHESFFSLRFQSLFEFIWALVIQSKTKINELKTLPSIANIDSSNFKSADLSHSICSDKNEEQSKRKDDPRIEDAFDQLIQLGFDSL